MSEEDNNSFEGNTRLCSCCASCGITEIDDIKLVPCDDCDLIRYCSDECLNNHRPEHEEDCKKRAAELRDELLFKQPESSDRGDCLICNLPLPIDMTNAIMGCCSKTICKGCIHANEKRQDEMRLQHSCPFCRMPTPDSREEGEKRNMKRAKANDPAALCHEGVKNYIKGHYSRSFEYWSKAAELGDAEAHFKLSMLYQTGEGVEKDIGKQIHHLEEAAIGGNPIARFHLGGHELKNGSAERTVKHWIIAATLGDNDSIKALMDMFKGGFLGKEDLAAALRAHKAAVDATKSPQRKAAEEYYRKNNIH